MRKFLENNKIAINERLGEEDAKKLQSYVEKLEAHYKNWKDSELAVLHHKSRLITDKNLRMKIRKGLVEYLNRKYNIPTEDAENNLYRYLGYSLGKDITNFIESSRIYRFFSDSQYRKHVGEKTREKVRNAKLFLTSEEYRMKWAKNYINNELDRWLHEGRIEEKDFKLLKKDIESGSRDLSEYLLGFGFHLGVEAFDRIFIPTPAFIAIAALTTDPRTLLPISISPMLRSLYTISRKIKNRDVSYKVAGIVGALPTVGILGYPLQLNYGKYPRLSKFLVNSIASKVGRNFPIIGGKDTRIEHSIIHFSDKIMKFLDRRTKD